jgi:hypothetical protein
LQTFAILLAEPAVEEILSDVVEHAPLVYLKAQPADGCRFRLDGDDEEASAAAFLSFCGHVNRCVGQVNPTDIEGPAVDADAKQWPFQTSSSPPIKTAPEPPWPMDGALVARVCNTAATLGGWPAVLRVDSESQGRLISLEFLIPGWRKAVVMCTNPHLTSLWDVVDQVLHCEPVPRGQVPTSLAFPRPCTPDYAFVDCGYHPQPSWHLLVSTWSSSSFATFATFASFVKFENTVFN